MSSQGFLVVREVEFHPNSVLNQLEKRFETPSIVRVFRKDSLRKYNRPPLYDVKYLVLFEDLKVVESNLGYVHFDFMFPVLICRTSGELDKAKALFLEKKVPYSVYYNEFTKENAYELVRNLASEQVTQSFCKTLVSRVGLSPQRIVSAIMVCEQVGYKESYIARYIDKYTYIDTYDIIESLLGIPRSKAQVKRAALYIHLNRLWYRKYTKLVLVKDVDTLIKVCKAWLEGTVTSFTVQEYVEKTGVSRYKVLYARDLLGRVSLVELLSLHQFLQEASILEVAMRLS